MVLTSKTPFTVSCLDVVCPVLSGLPNANAKSLRFTRNPWKRKGNRRRKDKEFGKAEAGGREGQGSFAAPLEARCFGPPGKGLSDSQSMLEIKSIPTVLLGLDGGGVWGGGGKTVPQIAPLPLVVALNRSSQSQIATRYAAFWHAASQIALASFLQ